MTLLVEIRALGEFDRSLLAAAQSAQSAWLDVAASLLSIAGHAEVIAAIALGVALARLRFRRRDWWVPLAVGIVVGIETISKLSIPQAAPPEDLSRSISFLPFIDSPLANAYPSGHVARFAFLAAAFGWPSSVNAVLVGAMAVSRVYLADHWPSDVIGGWLLGYGIAVAVNARRSRIRREATKDGPMAGPNSLRAPYTSADAGNSRGAPQQDL